MTLVRKTRKQRRRGQLILVIGGASSGKSTVALDLAGKDRARGTKRIFVATGQPLDDEMAEKIARHRAARGAGWVTEEVPVDLAGWFEKHGQCFRTIVLDCLTLWLSNLRERGIPDTQVSQLVASLLQAMRQSLARVVVVTNELGLGLVPQEASARRFRDSGGQLNQQVAEEADEVHFVISGVPVRIK